ncbi:MAG: hypothetical protein NTV86_00890 [Planctomycetota bacterium]|nr:hypothetical protein [Planctomycetota bacterium]
MTFEQPVLDHLSRCVLDIVDHIGESLGMRRKSFQIELVTPEVASVSDLSVSIAGCSADAPVFLALVSAMLKMPLRQDIVATGHIASVDGEVRPVKHIPVKLAAAAPEQGVNEFICPAIDTDGSMSLLAPNERATIEEAIAAAKDRIRVACVSDVRQLLEHAVDEESLVLAALRCGYFNGLGLMAPRDGPLGGIFGFLTTKHDQQFWHALEVLLATGDGHGAKRLFLDRCRFHSRQGEYPSGLGTSLQQIVRSLPMTTRRSKAIFPLVSLHDCLQMAQFARPDDNVDVQVLIGAMSGKGLGERGSQDHSGSNATHDPMAMRTVEAVLEEISAESLAKQVGLPIDSARAAYVLNEVVIDSHEAFFDRIESFYIAMVRQAAGGPVTPSDMLAAEAHDLLSGAFADKGGVDAALAEARYGTNGGMRYVLDVMTAQLKAEQQTRRINQVLKTALDPMDWDARVAFMAAFLERVGPQLPPEICSEPPQRYARHYEVILREYVKSLNAVTRVLQRF